MAWRIDEQVIRGEIDNRTRGRVVGRIWFVGLGEPVELDLVGNCWRDLAGQRLEFTNPKPKEGDLASLARMQDGVVGDITASRKVRVLEFPLDQMHLYYKTGREMPWHWGNSLYLEWFSTRNGRVMIESSSFEMRIDGEATWEMSPEEEAGQRKANGTAMTGFMDRFVKAANLQAGEDADEDAASDEWESRPQTEEEAEAMQARSDLLADRVMARMDREGEGADYEKILEEEIERMRVECGDPEPTEEDLARNAEWIEEALANPDPELEAELEYEHPLAKQADELTERLMWASREESWIPENVTDEHPVADLIGSVMSASAKFAGALNGSYWPPPVEECASVIVRLKRACGHLDDALVAAESCREEKLMTMQQLGPTVVDIIDLAHDARELIAELREKLERGTD